MTFQQWLSTQAFHDQVVPEVRRVMVWMARNWAEGGDLVIQAGNAFPSIDRQYIDLAFMVWACWVKSPEREAIIF